MNLDSRIRFILDLSPSYIDNQSTDKIFERIFRGFEPQHLGTYSGYRQYLLEFYSCFETRTLELNQILIRIERFFNTFETWETIDKGDSGRTVPSLTYLSLRSHLENIWYIAKAIYEIRLEETYNSILGVYEGYYYPNPIGTALSRTILHRITDAPGLGPADHCSSKFGISLIDLIRTQYIEFLESYGLFGFGDLKE